jgi:pimeloyl-ACP methyl ester carboxylesterase
MRKNLELTGILYFYSYAAQRTKYENSIKESRLSISNYSAFVQNELLKYHINDQESSLAVPSLLIFGLYDPYFIRSSVRRLHWSIRNSKLEIFEFSGHFPWIEEPNHFVEVVKAFVSPPAPVVKEGAK